MVATAGQHPINESHVDRLGLEGLLAGRVDGLVAVAADQSEQPVDLAHFGPGQRMIQQRGGVGANVWAVGGGAAVQAIQIAQRVDGHIAGQIRRISVPVTGFLPRCTLISWPRQNSLTVAASARASSRCPIRSPGTEYRARATSTCRSGATLGRV